MTNSEYHHLLTCGTKRIDLVLVDMSGVPAIRIIGYLWTHKQADSDHVIGYIDKNHQTSPHGLVNMSTRMQGRPVRIEQTDKIKLYLETLIPKVVHQNIQQQTIDLVQSFLHHSRSSINESNYTKVYSEMVDLMQGVTKQSGEEEVWIRLLTRTDNQRTDSTRPQTDNVPQKEASSTLHQQKHFAQKQRNMGLT